MIRIAVLITTFNRVDVLNSTLDALENQIISSNIGLDIFLLDDGCTDNTSVIIRSKFPKVNIVYGNGTLFWNRGMLMLWEYADKYNEYQFFLWLNDDTKLYPHALEELLDGVNHFGANSIIVGTIALSSKDPSVTYGGYRDGFLLKPLGFFCKCDYFNGNCVLIPNYVVKRLGKLSPVFRHSFGDFEYGMRARKSGVDILSTRIFIGECKRNPWPPKYLNSMYSLNERFTHLYSPLGFNPFESFYIEYKYNSLGRAVLVFIKIHLNTLFPQFISK
jgi:glycosyltransferase involved in cell wall biosynthesis